METATIIADKFGKDCLNYTYKWDVPLFAKNKRMLDRTHGYEMLYFINDFFSRHNLSSMISFKRAEYLLYNHLPINIKNKKEIRSWLIRHWDYDF
jgi:hypothetical protein